jgi:hypothetical protein
MVDRSPGGPRPVDQAHGIFSSKINTKFDYSRNFATRPLGFFEIELQFTKFQEDLQIFKNNSRYSPSHFQKLQIGP